MSVIGVSVEGSEGGNGQAGYEGEGRHGLYLYQPLSDSDLIHRPWSIEA